MSNPMDMAGKTVIVTGAAQGIGLAVAQLVHHLGANVVPTDIQGDALKASWDAVEPSRVMAVCGSITDPDFAQHAIEQSVVRFGDVNGLVNNAGITRTAMTDKMTLEDWNVVIDVNQTGAFIMSQAFGRHQIARYKSGVTDVDASIVNVSSIAARRGAIGQINYAAAKAAMIGMSMSLAREWGRYGVRSNAICFGIIDTDMTEVIRGEKFRDRFLSQIPLGRFSTPDEVAKPVCFLLSGAASYVNGQTLGADGGMHIQA